MNRRSVIERLASVVGAGWLLLNVSCSRQAPVSPKANGSAQDAATNSAATSGADEFTASLPHVGGPSGYVGSKSCRACHEDQFSSWHRSFHRTMTQIAAADSVRADFNQVALTNDGTRFTLRQTSNEYWVRMERAAPALTGEPVPEPVEVRMGLVTGSHHMQVFWVPSGEGNVQVGFPFTWLIPEQRWVPRHSTFIRPPDAVHRPEIWNVVCSRCHSTGIEPRVDTQARIMSTRVGELGISCEACHGPGQRHRDARLAGRDDPRAPDAQTLRAEIVQPKKLDPIRSSQVCGFCHSMKWIDKAESWRQLGFRYRPGDDLEQTTPIIRPSMVESVPALADYLSRNPELLRDFFWSDGMIRVSGREYNGLIESPCYKEGKFSCLSCHSMHDSEPNDQLAQRAKGNSACTQCHASFGDEAGLAAHTHHRAESSGSECYNCHMPHTTYGVLKAIRSHQITSPKVADQIATGRPNACNLCHLDKPLAWTADQLSRWYGQPKPGLSEDQNRVADAVRLALTGDAGQRAIIAWHLGWSPAIGISGTNWIAPVLGQLLDDPYAAVRCVAERSFRLVSTRGLPGYDFTISPASRPAVQTTIVDDWTKVSAIELTPPPVSTLVRRDNPAAMSADFLRLVRVRDERPVRLRE